MDQKSLTHAQKAIKQQMTVQLNWGTNVKDYHGDYYDAY